VRGQPAFEPREGTPGGELGRHELRAAPLGERRAIEYVHLGTPVVPAGAGQC